MKTRQHVVIVVEGGLIQEIYSDAEVEVVVIDHDTDGWAENELGDSYLAEEDAFVSEQWCAPMRQLDPDLWRNVLNHLEKQDATTDGEVSPPAPQ